MTTAPTLGRRVYKFLASLWLTLIILALLVVILILANRFGAYDLSAGSLRRDFYGSWWFNALLGLLMVNLVACTVIRKPWKFWQWGFLVTHAGVLTLMVGAGISFNWKIYGDMTISEGGTEDRFEVEGERELVITSGAEDFRHPLTFNPYVKSKPNVRVPLPAGQGAVRIKEYLPNVSLQDAFAADPRGRYDVIEVKLYLEGRLQSTQWIPKGGVGELNRLALSYSGADEVRYQNLTQPSGDQGTLAITVDGASSKIDVKESLGKPVVVGGRTFTIRERYGALTIDGGKTSENLAAPESNPALVFDVETGGKTETFYVYALHPEHGVIPKGSGMHQAAPPGFTAEYRVAARVSRFWVFAFPEGLRYVLTTQAGPGLSGPLKLGDRIKHPVMPMDFQIEVSQRIPRAEPTMVEEELKKGRARMPAIRVAGTGPAEGQSVWMRLYDRPWNLKLPKGEFQLRFEPRIYSDLGVAVHLVRFKNPPHPGTGNASKFESELRLTESDSGQVIEGTTGVNYPFTHKGWSFYQSSFNDKVSPVQSTLQVSYDPGKPVLYLGCIMVVSGTVFMLFLKPLLLRLVKAAKGLQTLRPASGFTMAVLIPLSAGTLAGMTILLLKPGMSALLVGALMAATGIALAFGTAAAAISGSRRHPAPALGVGKLVSLTWCLNTAALVILMWTRVT